MAGPFLFFKPAEVDQAGWDAGAKRQTVGLGQLSSDVALSGQDSDDLEVQPSVADVVHVAENSFLPDERRFRLTGTKLGDTKLEAKDANGAVVASMEVRVVAPLPTLGPPVSGAPRTGQTAARSNTTLKTSPWPARYPSFSQDTNPNTDPRLASLKQSNPNATFNLQKALDAAIAAEGGSTTRCPPRSWP